jgi:hypothetical protein
MKRKLYINIKVNFYGTKLLDEEFEMNYIETLKKNVKKMELILLSMNL